MIDPIEIIKQHSLDNPISRKELKIQSGCSDDRSMRDYIHTDPLVGTIPGKGGYFYCRTSKEISTANSDAWSRIRSELKTIRKRIRKGQESTMKPLHQTLVTEKEWNEIFNLHENSLKNA